jgi:hypothetical protein
VPSLLLVPHALVVFADPSEFGVEPRFGFLADASHFGFELARGGFLCSHSRFLRGQLAQRLGFELRLRLRETGFRGFLAKAIQLAAETRLGFFTDS